MINRFVGNAGHHLIALLLTVIILLLSACAGGGSAGTGDRIFTGRVLSLTGEPAPGITVTISETGDFVVTDEAGVYTIQTSTEQTSVEYLLEGPGFAASFLLTDVAAGTITITVDFEIDRDEESSNPIRIEEDDGTSSQRVQVCHIPRGNAANGHTITISESALPAHLAHGDTLGACEGDTDDQDDDPSELQVTICHMPGGNPANAQTITIGESSVADHLAHGDSLGACSAIDDGNGDDQDDQDDDPVGGMLTVCHNPSGIPNNAQTITIDEASLSGHLAHGDTVGPC